MEKLDEQRLELDLVYRYEFLKNFIGFGDEDVAAIRKLLAELVVQVPEIVKDQYNKLLAYDRRCANCNSRPLGICFASRARKFWM